MEKQIMNELNKYCKEINKLYKSGNIESSYNKPMIDLISSFGCLAHDFSGERSGKTGENVDIKLWHLDEDITKVPPFGAIEVKKIGGEDERARKQILIESERYGNVILTDNVVWKFFNKDKKMYNGFKLFKRNDKNEFELDESKIELFVSSIKDFILSVPSYIKSSNKLAYYMAEYAKTIKTIVYNILEADSSKPMFNELYALFSKLKQDLLPELTTQAFSDMYAQTIVYGLFIARYNDKNLETFSRGEAIENLAKESSLLKNFFQHIATSNKLHPTLDETIDKLCYIFLITDLKQLLDKEETKDVIVHFYEDFLSFYDAEQRKSFGAYYTPVQVVRFIINMVDKALVEDFKIDGGLSNNDTISIKVKSDPYQTKRKEWKDEKIIDVPKVAILDPACGTGTFGAEIIRFVKDKYFSGPNAVFYKEWLQQENGLMSRLISFEIMMTSYVIAHLKIRRVITETLGNQHLDADLPSNIYLTNTLAEPKSLLEKNSQITFFDFSGAITDEAENADKWKARRPIQVIIGNPPYLANSKNDYDISSYKFETDGKTPFGERKHLLNDDYVKFIKFAEKHIQKDGSGILAYITNNGYLDNVTFRGMRGSLLRTFDKIYIVNLHGNSIKQEESPDGGKDENVFNIMVGVAIIIGIKTSTKSEWAKLYYSDIYGTRDNKFNCLEQNNLTFKEVNVDQKNALFIPIDTTNKAEYNKGISLEKLFNIQSTGTDSGNDDVAIANSKQTICQRVEIVRNALDNEPIIKLFGRFGRGGTAEQVKQDVERNGKIIELNYRPFEERWTYYSGACGWLSRSKSKVMQHFVDENKTNLGIIFSRGGTSSKDFTSIFITKKITDIHFFSDVAYIAPLYLYNNDLINEKTVNYNQEELNILTQNLSKKPTPIQVFDYCYGVLNDLNYRKKYNEFLKRDYPKVPIIENQEMLEKYANPGEKLRKLHLMETPIQKDLGIESDNNNLVIEQVKYQDGKVYINKNTAITGITDEIWNFYIGGYQVLDKYLKSHKGEIVDREKFTHIRKVAGIIEETIKIQKQLRGV